ncbi:MAG TPA: hypothetical protein VGF32_33785 [Streptosporangiaceae bacterium]
MTATSPSNTKTPSGLAAVADDAIRDALTSLWGGCAPATWNRKRAAVASWLSWRISPSAMPTPA